MYRTWTVELLTPMMPSPGNLEIQDLAYSLSQKSSQFSGQLNPVVKKSIAELVRSMNCHYSNLIEGHNTHPIDIEKAMQENYSSDAKKRDLQREARAHIQTQLLIDLHQVPEGMYSAYMFKRLHREFFSRVPESFLTVKSRGVVDSQQIVPGYFRNSDVQVGRHIAPPSGRINEFLKFIQTSYQPGERSMIDRIIAIAAAHHRFLWVHPFYDGNGRVIRLVDHAAFARLEIGNSLWSASRGLARNSEDYKKFLMLADQQRRGDVDGRGNLSLSALCDFIRFYLKVCIDQIEFMQARLAPTEILSRIEDYSREQMQKENLPKTANLLLRHAFIFGEFERGQAASITGYQPRQARTVLSELLKKKLLKSDTAKGAVRLDFSVRSSEIWLPQLYSGL